MRVLVTLKSVISLQRLPIDSIRRSLNHCRHGLSNVGGLLKRKAEQGVRVVLLVWNEKLSTDRTDGVMATHDNETENFFEGTEVRVQLVTRQKEGGLVEDQFVSFCYSHHQKGHKLLQLCLYVRKTKVPFWPGLARPGGTFVLKSTGGFEQVEWSPCTDIAEEFCVPFGGASSRS